ncbi:MAG TPA: thioredoxin domain-containing protein [Vicinamibacteria bacterium]|nr:thioredoxin domain-containing protein [Vicinamibacteria bacterium]
MRSALLLLAVAAASSTQDERSRGPASAPVTVIEYCDFQCPVCAKASPQLPRLLAQAYGSKVRFVYRDFPLTRIHPDSTGAAEAAACAQEQGRFWQMHDLMFANQGNLDPAGLSRLAAEAGLNVAAFDRCISSPRARWKRDVALGQSSGVSATPTFVINGRRVEGIRRFEDISSVIDEALARSAAPR